MGRTCSIYRLVYNFVVVVGEHEEKRETEIMKCRIQNIVQTFFKGRD